MLWSVVMLGTLDDHWPDKLQRKAEAYAMETFGLALNLEPAHTSALPFYLVDRYSLWLGDLLGRQCAFMAPRPAEINEGWGELPRHRDTVRFQLKADLVILLFDSLPSRRRKKLIAERIAFMVPGAQLFIPEMLLELREGRPPKAPMLQAPQTFAPTTQLLAIAALINWPVAEANATTLARRFGVAAMSMVRAFDELQAAGVADTSQIGRERTLRLKAKGRELWGQVEAHLQSPVRKVRRVVIPYPEHFPGQVAGESALALYTPLASPRTPTLAVAAANWNRLFREHLTDVEAGYGHGDDIQTWSYDPAVLAEGKVVDRVSLYLSVRHHTDERVAQAAENLLEQMPW
jgi:DNA-binding MarR family transcriptional regulator